MRRFKLLLAMAALSALLLAAVCLGSPYAAVVQPAPENIEDLWAIEDMREQSDAPLVTMLQNHGVPLAYDKERNTFYCTLGLENGETWPQLHLTAPDSAGVELIFADDYAYDWCSDAIRDGYAYQIMAYNDTHFSYSEIVFTGLPMIMIETDAEITTEDSPIHVIISACGDEPLSSYGRIHRRGASTLGSEKGSYKIEFTREADGRRKAMADVPLFGMTDSILLNGMLHDRLLMREKLSWDLYESLSPAGVPFGARRTEYAEVFLNGTYHGVFLLTNPMDCAEELAKDGRRALTDYVYRTAVLSFSRDRAYVNHPRRANTGYELYYHPDAGSNDPFLALQPWIELNRIKDDEEFIGKALELIDLESMIRMDLFVQAGGMTDNIFNNMYIIAHPTEKGIRYSFAPWDMDMTWARKPEEIGQSYENWIYFPIADRLINLNAGGNLRQMVKDIWLQMRENAFNTETVERLIGEYTFELGDTGAWARNAERWEFENYYPDSYEMLVFSEIRFDLMDRAIDAIAEKDTERISFLEATQYEGKGTPIEIQ